MRATRGCRIWRAKCYRCWPYRLSSWRRRLRRSRSNSWPGTRATPSASAWRAFRASALSSPLTIQHLEACGVDLYLDQQAIDTTTAMGKLVADDDPPTHQSWAQARGCPGRETRSPEDRQRDRAEGAKAACERYLEGRQIARHRHWHGPAHLKGASNEPARGAAMSKGEQPQALGQSLQKSFATRWTPRRGDFSFGVANATKLLVA